MSRVLIVEPDFGLRETLDLILRMAGYSTRAATDGGEALRHALAHPPAAIVLATALPVLDGWSFIVAYRSACGSFPSPVVVMTHDRQEAALAREIGADAILPMPFDATDLLATVQRVVHPSVVGGPAQQAQRSSTPSPIRAALTA